MNYFVGLGILLAPLFAISQEHRLGSQLGFTRATTDRVDYDYYPQLGVKVDAFYDYRKSLFTTKAGIGFMHKGFSQELIYVDEEGNVLNEGNIEGIRHNYINVSLVGGIHIGDRIYGFTNVGGRVAYYLSTRASAGPVSLPDGTTINGYSWVLDYLEPFDFSLLFETGIGWVVNDRNEFRISLSYDRGLKSVGYKNSMLSDGFKHHNLSLQMCFVTRIFNGQNR